MAATRQYKKKGAITALVYCILQLRGPSRESATRAGDDTVVRSMEQIRNAQSPAFFFGTDKGAICYADDLGHCAEVHIVASAIDSMLFFEETARLLVITRSMMLTQYQVAADGKVSRLSQVKLSVAGDILSSGIKSAVWVGSGLIAAATLEKVVRVFDVAADEAYTLPLMDAAATSTVDKTNLRADKVTAVAFCPLDR